MSVIPYENYDSMIYPSIEQFDDEVWYYLSEYNGYVQNRNVIDIYYTPIMYFERSESGQWLLSDMINIYWNNTHSMDLNGDGLTDIFEKDGSIAHKT